MYRIDSERVIGERSNLLYGHFMEHFHRQIYDGIYDVKHPLADKDGFRKDVVDAMKKIKVPIIRWPGGCFVSSYHWKKAVGEKRTPFFDKAWRVEDPNSFGTDEFIKMCKAIGCEPYICTNAGTGTAEEMSDWVEYCNLETEGEYAKWRIANGYEEPHKVRYWSIGNENYGGWEIGAKDAKEWGRLVLESAKMMKHVDPTIELSAAAIADVDWNMNLLQNCGTRLDWISLHKYWNLMPEENDFATYEESMAYTNDLDTEIRKVRGLLSALGLEKDIKIAYDEWNLRGWHHPGVHSVKQAVNKEDYILPRDKNDRNQDYTMADAVFTACFLNTLNRNCDIVKMANFAPIVNTRGCIYTWEGGIVLRSTYHVFDLYVNYLGEEILDMWNPESPKQMAVKHKAGHMETVDVLDVLATRKRDENIIAVAAINKSAMEEVSLEMSFTNDDRIGEYRICTVNGPDVNSYNDVNLNQVQLTEGTWQRMDEKDISIPLQPHSVNVIQFKYN